MGVRFKLSSNLFLRSRGIFGLMVVFLLWLRSICVKSLNLTKLVYFYPEKDLYRDEIVLYRFILILSESMVLLSLLKVSHFYRFFSKS